MKTHRVTVLMAILVIATVIFTWGRAFSAAGDAIVLTEAQVQKFLKVFPSFAQWIKKNSATIEQLPEKSDAMQIISAARLAEDQQSFLEKQGWNSEEFFTVAQQVLMAYVAVETGEGLQEGQKGLEAQRAGAMAGMQNNPYLTPEQQQMILQQLKQAEESMKKTRDAFKQVPPSNLALAKKYRDDIARVLQTLE